MHSAQILPRFGLLGLEFNLIPGRHCTGSTVTQTKDVPKETSCFPLAPPPWTGLHPHAQFNRYIMLSSPFRRATGVVLSPTTKGAIFGAARLIPGGRALHRNQPSFRFFANNTGVNKGTELENPNPTGATPRSELYRYFSGLLIIGVGLFGYGA